jgi:hypothetical protein
MADKKKPTPEKINVTERDILGITIDTETIIEMFGMQSLAQIQNMYRDWKKDPRVEVRTVELTFPKTFWNFMDSGKEVTILDEELMGYVFSTILLPFFDPIRKIGEEIQQAEKEAQGKEGDKPPTKH